jgi:signal transduction histidine kinase
LDQYSPAEDRMQALLTVDLINGRRADAPPDQSVRELTLFERLIIEQGGQLILQKGDGRAAAGYFPFGDASQPCASLMFVPIRSGNSVIGVFSIQSYKENAYSKEDLTALQSLADHCSGAFERIRSRERLRSLAAHLQSVREEERTRMAREIHDEFGQMLTGFKMDLSWLDKRLGETKTKVGRPALAEKVKSMSGLVDEMVRSVRRIAAELRPGVLDDLGLVAAIEWQAREFQKRTGIGCKLSTALDNVALPPQLSTAVFRILQETLTNVARHAQASHLTVSLAAKAKRLVLEVQDNGRGITEVERIHSKSFGLVGMRERAMILGGDFDIRGAPGKGTTVTVSIPLDHPADA